MPLILDPAVKVIDDEQKIMVLHPGDGKRFYADFGHFSAAFLDLPGIKFNAPPDVKDEVVRNKLRMGRALAGWNKKRTIGGERVERPSTTLEDYEVLTNDIPRFMREAETLYTDARPGDLVVIPGSGYNSDVLLAEIEGEFDPDFTVIPARYVDAIPARRLKFLDRHQPKYEFGRRQIKLMQNRQALIRVQDDADRHEFYEHAYGDYVFRDRSGTFMEVSENIVDQKDLTDALFLTNLYGAMHAALRAGKLEEFFSVHPYVSLDRFYNYELFGDISIEVHSPGFFGRPLKDTALAGFISAMTVLASTGVSPSDVKDIEIQNSANAVVSVCDRDLENDLRESMRMAMNADQWWDEVCGRQQKVNGAIGLKTKARLIEKQGNAASDNSNTKDVD